MARNIDLEYARSVAIDGAKAAGKLLLSDFRSHIEIEIKGYADFVTKLDSQCEEEIKRILSSFDDSIAFIGEETSQFVINAGEVEMDLPDTCWIVDPLDGTSNYAHGFAGYSISIALRINGELVVGVVEAPTLGETYVALKDEGSYIHYLNGVSEKIETKDREDSLGLIASSVPYRYPEFIDEYMKIQRKLFDNFEDIRRVGSAELDLAWVANGTWHAYLEMFLKPWDSSAGGLLVQEAGGVITDWTGDENAWLLNGQILAAANPRVHEKMLSLIE